tara:strand:+ start:541 stop:948 length:408 start_codon:yes stop_codon:yes gene_type:complete
MPLNCTNPSGFRFLTIIFMIGALVLSIAKSVVDQVPEPPLLRFCSINFLGFILFLLSIYIGRKLTDPKNQWFNNAFSVSGIALISYSSTVEVEGRTKSLFLPFCFLVELIIIIFIVKKTRLEPEPYIELTERNNI